MFDTPDLGAVLLDSVSLGTHTGDSHASEEYFEHRLHVVDEHLLEAHLPGRRVRVALVALVPHLEDDDFLDIPVFALALEVRERLRFLVLVLGYPIGCKRYMVVKIGHLLTFTDFCQELALNGIVYILEVRAAELFNLLLRDLGHAAAVAGR